MGIINLEKLAQRLWRGQLPWLHQHGVVKNTPHDYFSVYFKDANNHRFMLIDVQQDANNRVNIVSLKALPQGETTSKMINEITEMEPKIIHYKKRYLLRYKNIFLFTLDRYLRLITLKTVIARVKGSVVSGLKAESETISRDRYNLLRLLVAQYVNQRPSRTHSGFQRDDIIALLYGTLWYKHIQNDAYRRKLTLLLESLVITGDLTERDDSYYVQGQAITTLVEYEKEARRTVQQQKMHRNIVRFMLVITVVIILIVVVLLSIAGIVDLQAIWQKILQIKPVRFLLKFI